MVNTSSNILSLKVSVWFKMNRTKPINLCVGVLIGREFELLMDCILIFRLNGGRILVYTDTRIVKDFICNIEAY